MTKKKKEPKASKQALEDSESGVDVTREAAKGQPAGQESAELIAKLQSELLYQRAELENFKKRTEQRYLESLKFAAEPVMNSLLPVMDNLERAYEHACAEGADVKSVAEGLSHIVNQLLNALENNGVELVDAMGEKFDPNKHEALGQVPGEENNLVAMVHEKGYTLNGKLLRPAKVFITRVAE